LHSISLFRDLRGSRQFFKSGGARPSWPQHRCDIQGSGRLPTRSAIWTRCGQATPWFPASPPNAQRGAHPQLALRTKNQPQEWKLISLRECLSPDDLQLCDTPDRAAAYWREHIGTHPFYNPECECLVVLMLNTRRRIKGHCFVSIGTMDTILVHPREIFRLAIIASTAAIVVAHNHPSDDPTPSKADIRVTRDLIRAGIQFLTSEPGQYHEVRLGANVRINALTVWRVFQIAMSRLHATSTAKSISGAMHTTECDIPILPPCQR
jgi:hypothetical protein